MDTQDQPSILVQVDVQHVDAEIAWTRDAHHRVEIRPVRREIAPLKKENATPVKLTLDIIQRPRTNAFEYQINGKPFWKASAIPARIGETQLWTVTNNSPWSHPLHLHGFFFQVLDPKR